jgi:hypothetical protein
MQKINLFRTDVPKLIKQHTESYCKFQKDTSIEQCKKEYLCKSNPPNDIRDLRKAKCIN